MAEILIKNMTLPTEDEQVNITILSDGSVIEHFKNESGKWNSYRSGGVKAIEVPTHGDLIDRKKLLEHRFEVYDSNEEVCEDYIETYHVLEAPAIVEDSKERE